MTDTELDSQIERVSFSRSASQQGWACAVVLHSGQLQYAAAEARNSNCVSIEIARQVAYAIARAQFLQTKKAQK